MITAIYLIVAALIVVAIYFGIRYFVRSSQRFGGERLIICPQTGRQAIVEVDAQHAALTGLVGQMDLRLEHCSRWPIRQDCGQDCLLRLDGDTSEWLVRSVVERVYRGETCTV